VRCTTSSRAEICRRIHADALPLGSEREGFFSTPLDPELSQVMVKMEIGMAHMFGPRQLTEDGVDSPTQC